MIFSVAVQGGALHHPNTHKNSKTHKIPIITSLFQATTYIQELTLHNPKYLVVTQGFIFTWNFKNANLAIHLQKSSHILVAQTNFELHKLCLHSSTFCFQRC